MIRRPPRSTLSSSSAASDVYKRQWWYQEGSVWYPSSDRLSVNIVGRAGNGPGNHLWRSELQQFSNESRLSIHVNHLPPGTSKWNKIEHRLFASISMNWRTKPLNSLFVIISLIGATPPTGGLPGKAKRDKRKYLKGLKVTEKEKLNNAMNDFYGEWNYVITPDW